MTVRIIRRKGSGLSNHDERDIFVPNPKRLLWESLADHFREKITHGHWRANERLPGERSLSETYNVSLGTARRALLDLSREGLLIRRPGGSFVLDGSNPEAVECKYERIANLIRSRIESDVYRPGFRFGNERDLTIEFSVSQGTLRKAFQELENDTSRKWVATTELGRFVVDRYGRGAPMLPYLKLASRFAEEILSGKRKPGSRMPSEVEAHRFYGASHTRMSRAMDLLAKRGLITARFGSGRYVAEKSHWQQYGQKKGTSGHNCGYPKCSDGIISFTDQNDMARSKLCPTGLVEFLTNDGGCP